MFKIRKYIAKISRRFSLKTGRWARARVNAHAPTHICIPNATERERKQQKKKKMAKVTNSHSHTHIIYDCVSFFPFGQSLPLLYSVRNLLHFVFGRSGCSVSAHIFFLVCLPCLRFRPEKKITRKRNATFFPSSSFFSAFCNRLELIFSKVIEFIEM